MNRKQKIVLWIGVVVFLIITAFPWRAPRQRIRGDGVSSSNKLPYRRIQPPELYKYWIVIAVVTGALIISLKESK